MKETAKKANKTIKEQQQEISKILKNLQAGQEFTKDEATQLTQYLTAYTSALTLGKYPGLDITSYTQLINNFIKNINEKFKNNSFESIYIEKNNDPLIEDIGKINNMFDQIENLVKSQNQSSEINQNIEKINIEVEEEEKPKPEHVPNENPKCGNKMGYPSISSNNTLELSVETLDKFKNIQYVSDGTKYVLCLDTEVEVGDEALANKHVDIDGVTIDKSKQAFQVEFEDGKKTYAYYQELKLDMPYADIETLLENQKIKLELINYKDNFLQQYLKNQAGKVSGATDQDLKAMINLTTKVTSVLKSTEGIGDDVKANISTANTNLIKAIQQKQLNAKLKAFDDDQNSLNLFENFENLKTFISTNYTLGANSTYYINSNNEWTDNVGEAKFVISVGADPQTDVTITKKDTYCDLVYDKDGHITVEATPAKKYIDIITAPEEAPNVSTPPLECKIDKNTKQKALDELKKLFEKKAKFKSEYQQKRGNKKFKEDFKPASSSNNIFQKFKKETPGGILTQLQSADLDNAIKILKNIDTDILDALNATTISTTYKTQDELTKAINDNKTPYLKEMLTSSTIPTKLPLFSGDTQEEYIKKIDGNTTIYTVKDNPSKKYTVECSSSNGQNTVTIKLGDKTYAYTVSEAKCELPENVPEANKDLFEHFVYMALPDDKKKAFAKKLLSLEYDNICSGMDRQKKEKVIRLIAATESDLYKDMIKNTDHKQYLYIDESGNILTNEPDKKIKYVKFWKRSDCNTIVFLRHTP